MAPKHRRGDVEVQGRNIPGIGILITGCEMEVGGGVEVGTAVEHTNRRISVSVITLWLEDGG